MDDSQFDKWIKDKVENYRDTGVDEGSFARFYQRMSEVTYKPWYAPYKKIAGYATVVVLTSLLNFGLFTYFQGRGDGSLNAPHKENEINYARLMKDFELLKAAKTDTIYIFKSQRTSLITNPGKSPNNFKLITKHGQNRKSETSYVRPAVGINIGRPGEISEELKSFLAQYKLAYLHENGSVYLLYHNIEDVPFVRRRGYQDNLVANNAVSEIKVENDRLTAEVPAMTKNKTQQLSIKVLRAMEKHKMAGIGFQYGPEVGVFKVRSDIGQGRPGASAGLMVEFILSPALRVETGVKYMLSSYKVSAINQINAARLSLYPAIENDIGTLQSIGVTNHSLAFPLHLKYNYPLARDQYVFASAGISPQLFLTQFINYSYKYSTDTGGEDDFGVAIAASKRVDDVFMNLGTVGMSIGLEKKLRNKSIFQLSAFYSHSLKPMGVEDREFSAVGLRSALKFRVK